MAADPGLALVAARRNMIDESGHVLARGRGLRGLVGVRSGVEVARRVVRSGANPIGEPGGVLFRRADYESVGGWHGDRRWAMDLDLWIRLLARGRFLGLAETLAAFRVGGHSLSAANDASIYDDQRAIVDQLATTPRLRVRPVDRAIGRLGAPSGRLRRRLSSRSPPARAAGAALGCARGPRRSVLVDLDVDVHAGHERYAARVRDRDLDRDHLRDLLEVARRVGLREQ